jgi:signal transduction histidine kinase
MNALRRRFDALTLPSQCAWGGMLLAGALAASVWALGPLAGAWVGPASVLAGGFVATLTCALLARRTTRALLEIAVLGKALRQEREIGERNFVLDESSDELRRATSALRRLVDAHRRRTRALVAANVALGQRLDVRTHELSTLQDLSIGLASKSGLYELVDEALGALEQTLDYSSASVWARDKEHDSTNVILLGYHSADGGDKAHEELRGQRLSRTYMQQYLQLESDGAPLIDNNARQGLLSWLWSKVVDDARTSALYRATRAWMAVPLRFREDVLAVLRVDHQEPNYFNAERARLLTAIGSQAALAIHHSQLLTKEREVAVASERNRIARDLHDAVSQTLFAANVMAGTLAGVAGRGGAIDSEKLRSQAEMLARLIQGALAEMRMLMFELRPDALQDARLSELLQHAIDALRCRGEFVVEQRLAPSDPLSGTVRAQVYRIAQEAISNAARHSGASQVSIEWSIDAPRCAVLRVADNGKGFDASEPRPGHFGLANLRARAAEIGAVLSVTSSAEAGSEVRLEVPLVASSATLP